MGEEPTTPTNPPAGADGAPKPVAATTSTDPLAGEGQNDEPLSLEEARKIRSESTNLRMRLKDSEKLLAELKTYKEQIEDSQRSEQEKQALSAKKLSEQLATLQKERDDALSARRDDHLNHAIQLLAAKQGLDPGAACRVLDKSALEFDDDGNPKNLEAVFKSTVTPFLKPATSTPTSGGATNPPRSQTDGSVEITEQYAMDVLSGKVKGLTTQQIAKVNEWVVNQQFGRFNRRVN